MSPRAITVDDLVAEGISEAEAKRIVKNLKKPKPRRIYWMFKATEKVAAKVAKAFPELTFGKRYHPRAKKE